MSPTANTVTPISQEHRAPAPTRPLASVPRPEIDRGAPPALRRIWELDPARLGLIVAALLRRDDVVGLLSSIGRRDLEGCDERLWVSLLRACGTRCALAEAVEAALTARTEAYAPLVQGRPMIVLADWWSRSRDDLDLAEVAGLLWRLSRDPRPHLEKLTSRVAGELTARALGNPEDHAPAAEVVVVRPRRGDALRHERAAVG